MAPMNEAALKSMTKMIQVMLPYENEYEPKEKSTQAIQEIFEVLQGLNPKASEFEGVFNYILKQMDAHGDSGEVDRMLMSVWAIIHKHYPSPDLDYPEDLGEDDFEHQMYPEW